MSRAAKWLLLASFVLARPALTQAEDAALSVSLTVGEYSVRTEGNAISVSTPDGFVLASPGEPALPWLSVFVPGYGGLESKDVRLVELDVDTIDLALPIALVLPAVQTRDTSPSAPDLPAVAMYTDPVYPANSCRAECRGVWQGQSLWVISWCPFRYHPTENRLEIIRRAEILITRGKTPNGPAGLTAEKFTVDAFANSRDFLRGSVSPSALTRAASGEMARTVTIGVPTDVDYVIITNEMLLPALRPLAQWRQKQGYRAGIALISEIERSYPGEDTPARIRAYLSEAHAGGLRFCVLGGDESVVPIRYAYHAYSDTMPAYDKMQICDLYYADLTGNWDVDGDRVYGEYLQDSADFFPELYVGRLLASDAAQAEAIIDKIITYETNPGNGDPAYLTRALFTCADQMRDWNGGQGQHTIIGAKFPADFTLDLTSQSENPLGSLPDPSLPEGEEFVQQEGSGWGWTIILNHGRADGFILRAAGINQWPKSYVWSSGVNGDGHGHLNLLTENSPPGIFLSVACDIGGFDLDGPLFGGFYGPNVAELLMHKPSGGAVAVIAYSRWGWVASSYRIMSKFIEYAFDPTIAPQIGVAFALAKADFPYYRDQNFGLNLYGDPAMPLWTAQPKTLQADFPAQVAAGSGPVEFTVTHAGSPLSGVVVTAVYADTVFLVGETDDRGIAVWSSGPNRLGGYVITATKPEFIPVQAQLIAPISAGFEEHDGSAAPLTLEQNHPNPFNPATAIEFTLPAAENVRLDVYDILGRRVNTLLDGIIPGGRHLVDFNGESANRATLPSGVYFYRLQAGTQTRIRKMLLLR